MKIPGVYAIVNTLNDRRYVGSSVDIWNRWAKHRLDLRSGHHHSPALQRAWKQDGPDAFAFVILDEVSDFHERIAREQMRLDETAEPYNAINVAYVRCVPGGVVSPERRHRLSSALRGKPKSAAHRAALSAAKKGTKNPGQAARMRGRHPSPETREKMRQAHTGLAQSQATIAKRAATLRGLVRTPEWNAHLSAAKRGKPWSERRRRAHDAGRVDQPRPCASVSDALEMAPQDHVTH